MDKASLGSLGAKRGRRDVDDEETAEEKNGKKQNEAKRKGRRAVRGTAICSREPINTHHRGNRRGVCIRDSAVITFVTCVRVEYSASSRQTGVPALVPIAKRLSEQGSHSTHQAEPRGSCRGGSTPCVTTDRRVLREKRHVMRYPLHGGCIRSEYINSTGARVV